MLAIRPVGWHLTIMDESGNKVSREERLARQLRDNLHRRKAQARALKSTANDSSEGEESDDKR